MSLEIRDYKPADYDRLFEIDQSVFIADIAYSHSELRYYLRSRKCKTLVAEYNGEVVGFITGWYGPRRYGHIISIDVSPQHQRRHIGSHLLAEIESWLWQRGAEAIYLETQTNDSGAQGFYDKHGYHVLERIEDYYGDSLDAFVMMKPAK